MLMSLHMIARLGILALAASSLAALTAAQLRPEAVPPASAPNHWQAVAAPAGGMELVDSRDGRTRPIATPRTERWDYISASPWASEDGSMEAVVRYSALGDGGDGEVGLARVRLPHGEVLERIDPVVLPTGRAAWDPEANGRVVFPGATGRLYTCDFGGGATAAVAPLEWRVARPGMGEPFMIDPSWSRLPGPRKYLIVTMSLTAGKLPIGTPRTVAPWWLELDESGESIVDAGPLFDPEDPVAMEPGARIRHPSVVDRDGRSQLLYLRHEPTPGRAAVYAADLDLDPTTGRPRVRPGTASRVEDRATALAALIPSLDYQVSSTHDENGRAVFVLLASLVPR